MRPTAAQLAALKLAVREPIRYFSGGWYSTPAVAGTERIAETFCSDAGYTWPTVLRACVKHGWMDHESRENVYDRRWTITDSGRAELAKGKR